MDGTCPFITECPQSLKQCFFIRGRNGLWELDEALGEREDATGKEATGPEVGLSKRVLPSIGSGLQNILRVRCGRILRLVLVTNRDIKVMS